MAATGSLPLSAVRTPLLCTGLVLARRLARFGLRSNIDLGAVAQLVGAVDHDAIARRQPGDNLDTIAIGRAKLDRADRHRAVGVDNVDERARHAALDARR